MSEVFLRRLTPSLVPFVRRQMDYRIVSIHRDDRELAGCLAELSPHGLITEWLPGKTEGLLELYPDLPTVIVDTDYCYPGVVSIDVDDWAVGAAAAEAFLQSGLRSLACLGNGQPYSDQRIEGFCAAIDRQAPVSIHGVGGFENAGYSESFIEPDPSFRRWLQGLPKPVGIFAVHDPLGRFLCGACQQLGIKVPEDVAVIGANNDDLVCSLTYPMLSSVSIPWHAIGEVVGESMARQLGGEREATSTARLVPAGGVVLRHSADHLAIEDPLLRRAMSWLSERRQEPVSIGQLCDELRVARRTLERKFQEHYRCSPWTMLCRLRVNHAKDLLVRTNHPVSLVAELSGFNDPERMAVVFRKHLGQSPSKYRRSARAT